jgi:hypothetical protein
MNDIQKTVAGALLAGASLLTGNAALITVAGGVGVNWVSEGLPGLKRAWRNRKLDGALARAYRDAVETAIDRLRGEYVAMHGERVKLLAFDLVAASAAEIGAAEFPTAEMNVSDAQTALVSGLDALLFGHDAEQVRFLKTRLLDAVALALRDALAADDAAWRRFYGDLLENMRASQQTMSLTLARVDEVIARLASPDAVSFNTLNLGMHSLSAKLDVLLAASHASPPATPPAAGGGPVFDNQGMSVGGSVFQGETQYITNHPDSRVSQATGAGHGAVDTQRLRAQLVDAFTHEELETLCANTEALLAADGHGFRVSLDHIGARDAGIELRALKLVQYLERRGVLGYLVQAAHDARPGMRFG